MKKIIGVASCPAGIAHTYLAAESITKAAKKRGYEVKIETNGASGVENKLDKQDIEEACAVIIAADTRVQMERFRGKPLIEISVGEAIRKIDVYLDKIEKEEIEIF